MIITHKSVAEYFNHSSINQGQWEVFKVFSRGNERESCSSQTLLEGCVKEESSLWEQRPKILCIV